MIESALWGIVLLGATAATIAFETAQSGTFHAGWMCGAITILAPYKVYSIRRRDAIN